MWFQKLIVLPPKSRGFHIITDEILSSLSDIKKIKTGICHLFIQHTSASLTVNENADPSVRSDFESFFSIHVPEKLPIYTHKMEGSDDMPAHLKSSILGSSVSVPVTDGRFNLGTWQGIYLCEHRNSGGRRNILATVMGE